MIYSINFRNYSSSDFVKKAMQWAQQDDSVKSSGIISNEPAGFYDLDGQIVYLRHSAIVKFLIS